ncbi:hypothetical protein [Undibacterium terreum]|uniref:Cell envelope biogenesis protein TolA n=1 Tax=Undibacterium terreum TaxID=1224302 RepID=A0A916UK94_9BURK|nr:hypothetical protein [Undibacterium terreum]GGC76232.1 hypothetical protein GCM10011396_24380 [Undibacterium terreum]
MKKIITGLMFSVAAISICSTSFAATSEAKVAYKAANDTADNDYKVASAKCDALAGNAKDICVAEAKLVRTRAKSDAKANYENTPKAYTNAMIDVADAEYDVAKEKCDDKAGNDKDVCVKQAKAVKETAVANAKAGKKVADARSDAAKTKNDAEYKVAIEKCDGLAGPTKDACVASAKAQYGK